MTPPDLTDRPALVRHRARASGPPDDALFLHRIAADEIEERLGEVNRTFTDVAVVTGHRAFWQARLPSARVIPDEDTLELAAEGHDLVIHALCLHWANDPVGQLIQMRRALREDGLMICASFGGQTLSELRAALAEAEVAVSGGLSPRVLPMGDLRDLGALLQRAGFALPVADTRRQRVSYASARHLMRDLRSMGETNALSGRDRRAPPRRLFEAADEIYARSFPDGAGRVAATFDFVFLTGWAPSATQQKPLRPGSAMARLADALGSEEHPAGDTARSDPD